ncbi:Rieske 2Fe-2S domain-containing protein [Streptomyces sp. AV19]|uniref:cytochrome bc1 complex Rieske iron-sulfur subunit n=1 Tax=Streptomyces sp. AV19 TaxID=2793068 RepID=UPI0018FE8943|nr:Rieske 2Fe-2S domain-containing protein [Streptomyces sp. AV19]MBH1933600.1 Rieske 2Fe-2S domain-containing protein [Streptomyces sp. AV19]MDG4535937.1 Rieske (2Fe-2S) protein [Streptomyces sp. AV19]
MSSQEHPEAALPSERGDTREGAVTTARADPFADPGLPEHEPRIQDIDERAAKRSERVVAFLFTVSMLATVTFIVAYVAIPVDRSVYVFPIGHVSATNITLGLTLGVALFCLGAAAIHWARTLMSDVEMIDERHPVETSPEIRAKVLADFKEGAAETGLGRRKLIRKTMLGALTMIPLSGVVLLGGLTKTAPGTKLRKTAWSKGKTLINQNTLQPLRPEDIEVGSLTFAMPKGMKEEDHDFQNQIAKAAVMLVRLRPEDIKDKKQLDWSADGIVAYSRICTHVGCPITLYEQQTHHVMCPCHQSTFDMTDGARVVFGPAGHALPQLRIGINKDGHLEALGDFAEPVGPSFWERG